MGDSGPCVTGTYSLPTCNLLLIVIVLVVTTTVKVTFSGLKYFKFVKNEQQHHQSGVNTVDRPVAWSVDSCGALFVICHVDTVSHCIVQFMNNWHMSIALFDF